MIYSIDAELVTDALDYSLGLRIIKANNVHLFAVIPNKSIDELPIKIGANATISYYYGDFQYVFNVQFDDIQNEENVEKLKFSINQVEINNNHRKEKRNLVEIKALILSSKDMEYGVILDISDTGMKIETKKPILRKKFEVHFVTPEGTTMKKKAKIVWSKTGKNGHHYYGVKTK